MAKMQYIELTKEQVQKLTPKQQSINSIEPKELTSFEKKIMIVRLFEVPFAMVIIGIFALIVTFILK